MMTERFDPVNEGFGTPPPRYSLGIPISQRVSIETVKRRTAYAVYENHHSYLPRGRKGWHYGIMLDEQLVGAITFDAWPSDSDIRGYYSEAIREVARVCVVNETPNLASCAMAKAQDRFLSECGDGIEMLVTYVRDDYNGTMFKALRGKGWELDGVRKGHPPGNRDVYDIHKWDKQRWVCEL